MEEETQRKVKELGNNTMDAVLIPDKIKVSKNQSNFPIFCILLKYFRQ